MNINHLDQEFKIIFMANILKIEHIKPLIIHNHQINFNKIIKIEDKNPIQNLVNINRKNMNMKRNNNLVIDVGIIILNTKAIDNQMRTLDLLLNIINIIINYWRLNNHIMVIPEQAIIINKQVCNNR